jgi:predicted transcriptional regulator
MPHKSSPVVRMSLTLEPGMVDRLRELAGAQQIPVSEAVRRALAQWIEAQGTVKPEE